MPVDFPDTPVLNDTFTVDSRTWQWNGVAWKLVTSSVGPTGPTGPAGEAGTIGVDGEPGKFIVSATAPANPVEGDAWFNSANSRLYMYYDGYWVEASAPVAGPIGPTGPAGSAGIDGATGPTGPRGVFQVSDTMPVSAVLGDAWFDSSTSRTYVYFGNTWVEVVGAAGPAGVDGIDGGFDTAQVIENKSTSYTLQASDAGKLITNSAAVTITVQGLSIGQQVDFFQNSASQITFAAGAGITIVSKDNKLKTAAIYSAASVKCIASNTYALVGDLGA